MILTTIIFQAIVYIRLHRRQKGYKVGVVDLTMGELGTRGDSKIREKESKKASEILGLSYRENLSLKDGFIVNDNEAKIKHFHFLSIIYLYFFM